MAPHVRRKPGAGRERGMVTAETALALTAAVFVTLAMAWVVSAVTLQSRCIDAARDTARAVARGESLAASKAIGSRSAPTAAVITTRVVGDLATVDVGVDSRPPWPVLAHLPPVMVHARAVVALEPGQS